MTKFGIDVSSLRPGITYVEDYDENLATFGSVAMTNTKFFSAGKPPVWQALLQGSTPIYCFQTWDFAAFNTLVAAAGNAPFGVAYKQEAENKLATPAEVTDYLNVYEQMCDILWNSPNAFAVKIGMQYAETQAPGRFPYHWQDLDGGQRYRNLRIALDCYSRAATPPTDSAFLGALYDWANASGLEFGVSEFGIASDSPEFMLDVIESLRDEGATWANYWNTGGQGPTDPNWRVNGRSLQPILDWAVHL